MGIFDFLKPKPKPAPPSPRHLEILSAIRHSEHVLMTAIQDFYAAFTQHQERQSAAISGIASDVAQLKQQIVDLTASLGEVSPSDQALLAQMSANIAAATERLEALDALTPPLAPPVEPPAPNPEG